MILDQFLALAVFLLTVALFAAPARQAVLPLRRVGALARQVGAPVERVARLYRARPALDWQAARLLRRGVLPLRPVAALARQPARLRQT